MIIHHQLDPTRFTASGCIIDWAQVAATRDKDDPVKLADELKRLGLTRRMTHLRWSLNPGQGHPDGPMGMPGGPFHVMRRPALLNQPGPRIDFARYDLGPGVTAVIFDGVMSRVWVRSAPTTQVPSNVYAISGSPGASSVTSTKVLPPNSEIMMNGPGLVGLLVYATATIALEIKGDKAQTYANGFLDHDQAELVGLPVDPAQWTGPVATMAQPQGFWNQEVDPRSAAQDRLRRAAMLWGWDRRLEGDILAPPWAAPNSAALVAEVTDQLLPLLQKAFSGHSSTHAAQVATVSVPPPTNAQGKPIPGAQSSDAQVSPFSLLLSAVSTDPFLAVALGFGTAFETVDQFQLPDPPAPPPPPPPKVPKIIADAQIIQAQAALAPTFPPTGWQGPYDYLIVADYFDQKTSQEAAFDSYAALVMDPQPAVFSAGPANVRADRGGFNRPSTVDEPWSITARVSWDRLPRNGLFRPAGFAACRRNMPSATVIPLMETRKSGGLAPISANGYGDSVAGTPGAAQVSVVDREFVLPTGNAGVTGRYYVAQQDIFGRWSHWQNADLPVGQPLPDNAHLISATLATIAPAVPSDPKAARPTKCPAVLTVEFTSDWNIRRPHRVRLVGLLYPATNRGDSPAAGPLPTGFGRGIGATDSPIDIYFDGDTAAVRDSAAGPVQPGTSVEYLSPEGDSVVNPGAAQGESRRYRVHIPGFVADFAASPHVGIAIWASATERLPPQRASAFNVTPLLTFASNPIPPAVATEQVALAGLPDAAGNCHARIAWTVPPGAGATGYFVYTATETAMRDLRGKGIAAADETLGARKAFLKQLFTDQNSRREFTRINATPIPAVYNFTDVLLPRGTGDIHVYVVVATNGGNVESAWPTSADELIMVAAPRVAVPAAPTLEVRAGVQASASVTIAARNGPRVKRFDLHRVRVPDAARELDTMGPPAVTITDGASGWQTTRGPAGSAEKPLVATGQDTPGGSWKKTYYRAVAWAEDDLPRGTYGSRSPASPAVAIVVPPLGPPELSEVTILPNLSNADVLLQWSSTAPVPPTALGPHRLIVQATANPGSAEPLLSVNSELQVVPTAAPPAGASGVFRTPNPTGPAIGYSAVIRRSSVNQGMSIAVRVRDPLGRTSEQLVSVPAGPDPDITAVQLSTVSDLGTVLRWTTMAPLGAIGGLYYRVRVTVTPPTTGGVKPRTLTVELPMNAIPPEGPPGQQSLVLQRQAGNSALAQLRAVCRVAAATITVRITAPDGRFAEVTRKVS